MRTLRRDIFTSLGELLLLVPEKGNEILLKDARKALGSKVYNAIGKAVTKGLIKVTEDNRIIFTEKALHLGKCLKECFQSYEMKDNSY